MEQKTQKRRQPDACEPRAKRACSRVASTTSSFQLSQLGDDLLLCIFPFLSVHDLARLFTTHRGWHSMISETLVGRGRQLIEAWYPKRGTSLTWGAAITSVLWSTYNETFWSNARASWRPVQFMQLFGFCKAIQILDMEEGENHRQKCYHGELEDDEDLEFEDETARQEYTTHLQSDAVDLSDAMATIRSAQLVWEGARHC